MKERCFVFKLVDHDKKTTRVIEASVYDNKVMEWLHTEKGEEYGKWLAHHILWEKKLKKHVKRTIVMQYIGEAMQKQTGGNFGDYRLVKKMTRKEYTKINMNKNVGEPFLERKVKYIEKYITKLERGKKSVEWPEMLRYPKTFEHYAFLQESDEMDDNIKITPLAHKFILEEINIKHSRTSMQNTENKNITSVVSRNSASLASVQTGGRDNNKKYRRVY